MPRDRIVIKGAREHNLKNIDLEIPRDALVVITGLSGSGKSSLAFDTIYAEGQRRYVESLSAYARQFLEQMEKPDLDAIEGLSPAISIEQKTTSKNPRSTVGTVTEIYDYLRLLFARVGRPHCPQCGREIASQSVDQIVDQVLGLPEGSRIHLFSPIVRDRKGEYRKELAWLRRDGYTRVRIDGQLHELEEEIVLDKNKKHTIEVLVDRLVVKPAIRKRLADSLELCLKLAQGIAKVELLGKGEQLFSERFACVECGLSFPEITHRMFSFNSPQGACPECNGLGSRLYFDPDLVIPDRRLSLREGAVAPWGERRTTLQAHTLEALARQYKFDIYTPFQDLPERVQQVLLHGSGKEEVEFWTERDGRRYYYRRPFEGILPMLDRKYRELDADAAREEVEAYMAERPCPTCGGARLRPEALCVKVGGRSIHEITRLSVTACLAFFRGLTLTPREQEIARRILKEITERLGFMLDVGLDYLTLDRTSASLSGGEGQRIRLATQIGSSLVGVLYILDEPSIGLHQRDNRRLLDTLKRLRDMGNTVLVVEHDRDTILSADYVVDMGPGAGVKGGHIVACGTPLQIMNHPESLTGRYLSGQMVIAVPARRRRGTGESLVLRGAAENNLKEITVRIPLGVITGVTGVSGSGKSTLVIDTLYRALAHHFYRAKERPGQFKAIEGLEHVDKVIDIDQAPIGRTPRSNPATYTGVFTHIRDLFAQLPEARTRGYRPGRFSFNVKGGRCEACQGDGMIKIEMHFLPDVYVRCDVCQGRRYNRETLEVRYRGKNIAEVLDMTVAEALTLMENIPAIKQKLQTLYDVGLGYIALGQSATTLSGGEAQRIKLSKELSRRSTGRTLYILDEPTTGLHFDDIQKLLDVLNRLADQGNTIVIIEHNMDVIKTCDYLIDLGPEGGDRGGEVVAAGTPEEVARVPGSYTGQFLRAILDGHPKAPRSAPGPLFARA
ncbi:MAG: excinuclease ABC subunit UvrA [Deltaproteobacteria bacterium]|nr:excinuclease ABC subunit UvrA [Deltaproteobacteria bacterium]